MGTPKDSRATIRRSFVLPRDLVDRVREVGPPEYRDNTNRLVTIALEEYVRQREACEFEAAMAEMAGDPDIRSENRRIDRSFRKTERDGLDA